MMFLDGCFILKQLCNYALGINEKELHQSRWAPAQLRSDLTLLENQIRPLRCAVGAVRPNVLNSGLRCLAVYL
jgi:hypothetical protein